MDLAYLRAHPALLPTMMTHQRIRETPVPGGSICTASRLTLDDGTSLFAKSWPDPPAPDGFFAAEAAGLRWLREAGGAPVPEVIAELPDLLALEWVEPGAPTRAAASRFGCDLATTHRAGARRFGAPWPGFIGALPMDATGPGDGDQPAGQESTGDRDPAGDQAWSMDAWPEWFASRRLRPYLTISMDRGALSRADVTAVDQLINNIRGYAGPAADEPPARIHGDLWPGNLHWGTRSAWLVDPAAQGGHRETDLATLALFGGVPYFDAILAGYQEVWPLAPGWRERFPLHQLHLLLVHTALFGSGYRDAVMSAVRDTVKR